MLSGFRWAREVFILLVSGSAHLQGLGIPVLTEPRAVLL